jgi:hypothetical protein
MASLGLQSSMGMSRGSLLTTMMTSAHARVSWQSHIPMPDVEADSTYYCGRPPHTTAATLADETYQFPAVPLLPTGQWYHGHYINGTDGNTNHPTYLTR